MSLLLTTTEAADRLGYAKQTFHNLFKLGESPVPVHDVETNSTRPFRVVAAADVRAYLEWLKRPNCPNPGFTSPVWVRVPHLFNLRRVASLLSVSHVAIIWRIKNDGLPYTPVFDGKKHLPVFDESQLNLLRKVLR